jgi:DNA polymerase-3 subunit delta'
MNFGQIVSDPIVSEFDHLQHHSDARVELNRIMRAKKIPNALLFTGPLHSGRKEAAFWFAKAVNCLSSDQPGCGQCRSCKKIDTGTHPDIFCTGPDAGKKNILISQIRHLGSRIATKPNEARHRMILIESAHLMNVQAQNALLKMLEEPPAGTFFILIAERSAMLLSTILSRCRKIRFTPLPFQECIDLLRSRTGCDCLTAGIVVKTADRDLSKALSYLETDDENRPTDWSGTRKWLIRQLFDLLSDERRPISRSHLGLMLSWSICSGDAQLFSDRLDVVKTFFRDLAVCLYQPNAIVNLDFFAQFKDISQQLPKGVAVKWLSLLLESEQKLLQNSSARLTLDSFFLSVIQT